MADSTNEAAAVELPELPERTDWCELNGDLFRETQMRANVTAALASAQAREEELRTEVATRREDYATLAEMWRADEAKYRARAERMAEALRELDRAYVRLLESARDRIRDLGGECDPVDVMELSDIDLRKARAALSTNASHNTTPERGEG